MRPYAVVLALIARHGILPTVAPVKPYTLLALTCRVGGAACACARVFCWRGLRGVEREGF